jgi:class 3 adenylate cyclase
LECGAAFAVASLRLSEQRKTVTVVFCDVAGSTPLGEALDPEALRSLLARYFEQMKEIVERHGGTVEKFIGDAVMAVFGVPTAHEDDALRALRAAVEMRDVFPELGIEGRIGIATGEVVTGTEERLATGDAVNVAKRLEDAASPGEVLLGEETLHLAGGAAEVEPLAPLTLKGKREPVSAYRLVGVEDRAAFRREFGFVGRERELETLHQSWESVLKGSRCELVTVVGEPGIGKSRLVFEFVEGIRENAEVVSGRCLPYGEGITYWPVVEAVTQLGSPPSDPDAAAALRSLFGEVEQSVSAEEIAWSFRRLLEERAQQHPLLCVFDDLQWGEATFLDLLEHLALLSSGAPILVVCMARPELGDRRPSWPITLRLEPLAPDAVSALLPETLGQVLRGEIARSAAGNPLFLTEMAAMAGMDGDEVVVPPSLKALLAARLDQLQPAERHVIQCAAVEGEIFHRGALLALDPEQQQLTRHVASLVRKELIHSTTAQLSGDNAFRFRHLLLRDTAYEALPKATRAVLHERFASWLEHRDKDVAELDEIAGYHLEEAARYSAQLKQPDPRLAERASGHLAAAGRRALWRADTRAAAPLLERALELTRPLRLDIQLELDLAASAAESREVTTVAEHAAHRASDAGDKPGELLALVVAAHGRMDFAGDPGLDELERLARTVLPLLEQADDHPGLARVWFALSHAAGFRCHFEAQAEAGQEALRHFRLTGQNSWLPSVPGALIQGPRPADEALQKLDSVLPPNPQPPALLSKAVLLAMLDRFDEAWALALPAAKRLGEFRGGGWGDWELAAIAELAGDHTSAARHLREVCEMFERQGSRSQLSTSASRLGHSLCALDDFVEAERLAQVSRELASDQDLLTQALWRQVQALTSMNRGEHAEADRLAHDAVAITEETDGLNMQGDALCDLAEVLAAAGHTDEAKITLGQAMERYERKKNLAMVAQVRPRLVELSATPG